MRSVPLAILTLCYWGVFTAMDISIMTCGHRFTDVERKGRNFLAFIGGVLWTGTFCLAILGV